MEGDLKMLIGFFFSLFLYVREQQVKLGSPDYIDCNTEEAIQDFMKRIKCYENSYQPLDENLDRSEIHFRSTLKYFKSL